MIDGSGHSKRWSVRIRVGSDTVVVGFVALEIDGEGEDDEERLEVDDELFVVFLVPLLTGISQGATFGPVPSVLDGVKSEISLGQSQ